MRVRHVAALGLTAAIAAGGATVAVGQGTGGTLGPKAEGSTTVQLRLTERSFGVHCANTNSLRRCIRDENPRIASLAAGSGALYQGTQRVGRGHFVTTVTQRGRRSSSGVFTGGLAFADGTVAIQGLELNNDESLPLAITGGTGAYAGARGYMTDAEAPGGSDREFRLNLTLTFIP